MARISDMLKVEYRMLSEPAIVWWAGFRSDTRQLQQAGWELAAEESVYDGRIRLLLRHREIKLYALTNDVSFNYHQHVREQYRAQPLEFRVVKAAPEFRTQEFAGSPGYFTNFRQIDAQPQMQMDVQIKSIEDFKIFATPLVRTEELIVEPATVAELLDKIRKMQAPEQERIRAKARLESRQSDMIPMDIPILPRQAFHAQIISIADHRKAA